MASSLPKPRPLASLLADGRFSAEAMALLRGAAAETTRLGHRFISGEHLLIALIASDGPTGQVFREAGAAAEQARSRVEFIVPHDPPFLAPKEMAVSPRLIALLEDTAEAAEGMETHVEAPDLALALLRDPEGIPSRVLDECHINTRALIQRLRLLRG
ncbi:MAG TPA: Clp protease N-terminal domain-containing protein [Thermomicrobiales bacterium]